MDSQERKVFWQTLCSLPGKDIKAESEKLLQTIQYPDFLFRYRPVNLKNLEALRTNRLYFSSANYYDDPFDTFIHIDIKKIREVFSNAFRSMETTGAVVDKAKSFLANLLTEEQLAQLTAENVKKGLSQGLIENFLTLFLL